MKVVKLLKDLHFVSMIDLEVEKDVVCTLNIGEELYNQFNNSCFKYIGERIYIKKKQNKTKQKRPGRLEQQATGLYQQKSN